MHYATLKNDVFSPPPLTSEARMPEIAEAIDTLQKSAVDLEDTLVNVVARISPAMRASSETSSPPPVPYAESKSAPIARGIAKVVDRLQSLQAQMDDVLQRLEI